MNEQMKEMRRGRKSNYAERLKSPQQEKLQPTMPHTPISATVPRLF